MTLRTPSLLSRIVLRLTITTLIAIIAAYAWLWWEFTSTTSTLRDRSLIETARTIASATSFGPTGNLSLKLTPSLIESYVRSEGVHGFSVRDRSTGETLFSAGAETGPIPTHVDDDEDGSLYQYNPDGPGPASYFGEAFLHNAGNRQIVVQVVRLGSDYQDLIETILADFFEDGGWLATPFLILLLLVSIFTVRGTLAPLRELSQRAAAITPNAADVRLPLRDVPREILPLVEAVNRALDRLEAGYRLQREFTADAAHELRTPLAVLGAHIDSLPDKSEAKALRGDLDGMVHLVEQLLRAARAEALVLAPEDRADLCQIARDVAIYLGPIAIRGGRAIEVQAPPAPVWVHGQQDAIFHALRNLVDNALRHAPIDTAVTISVADHPATLAVQDQGPGVPPQAEDAIFRRFWRAERRDGGAGLGLSIVQKTMLAHGGEARLDRSAAGGACFKMVFPPR